MTNGRLRVCMGFREGAQLLRQAANRQVQNMAYEAAGSEGGV